MDLAQAESLLRKHRRLFKRAYIFGSVASGRQDAQSDLDLVLIRDTVLPFFDRIREVFDLVFELGAVDLLIYTDDERRQMMSEEGRFFLKNVFERGICIEGSQGRSTEMAQAG